MFRNLCLPARCVAILAPDLYIYTYNHSPSQRGSRWGSGLAVMNPKVLVFSFCRVNVCSDVSFLCPFDFCSCLVLISCPIFSYVLSWKMIDYWLFHLFWGMIFRFSAFFSLKNFVSTRPKTRGFFNPQQPTPRFLRQTPSEIFQTEDHLRAGSKFLVFHGFGGPKGGFWLKVGERNIYIYIYVYI